MKVLLLNGSPREKGCTYTALKIIADELEKESIKTEIVNVGSKSISSVGTDDANSSEFVTSIAKEIKNYDGFVFGSPVYYASPNGTFISFLDRLFACCKDFAQKPAACLVSCRRGGASSSLEVLEKYPQFYSMPLISSNYWNMVHGNTPEEVIKDEEGVQTMQVLGKNMAWILKCIENGKKQGIQPPSLPTKIKTNYIQ